MRRRITLSGATLLAALLVATLVVGGREATAAQAAMDFAFSSYQLGTIANESCPNTAQACTNGAAEPQIHADKSGAFYASSENGLGGGTDAWKSTDGGKHFNAWFLKSGVECAVVRGPGGAPCPNILLPDHLAMPRESAKCAN